MRWTCQTLSYSIINTTLEKNTFDTGLSVSAAVVPKDIDILLTYLYLCLFHDGIFRELQIVICSLLPTPRCDATNQYFVRDMLWRSSSTSWRHILRTTRVNGISSFRCNYSYSRTSTGSTQTPMKLTNGSPPKCLVSPLRFIGWLRRCQFRHSPTCIRIYLKICETTVCYFVLLQDEAAKRIPRQEIIENALSLSFRLRDFDCTR